MNGSNASPEGRSPRQWQAYIEVQVKQGRPAQELVDEAIAGGLPEDEARTYVQEAVRTQRSRSAKVLGCSVIMLVGGVLLTLTTFAGNYLYLSGKPYYAIWFGAVICGLIGIVYGIRQLTRLR